MGKLNIAHHKSYHPYRRDNIERVRKDEEEARLEQLKAEGRMTLADSEARIQTLRQSKTKRSKNRRGSRSPSPSVRPPVLPETPDTITTTTGHINFFSTLESSAQSLASTSASASSLAKKMQEKEADRGIALTPDAQDLRPWYTSASKPTEDDERSLKAFEVHSEEAAAKYKAQQRKQRELRRKAVNDPLNEIKKHSVKPSSRDSHPKPTIRMLPPSGSSSDDPLLSARLARESAERARAEALIRAKQREISPSYGTASSIGGDTLLQSRGYGDVYNKVETREAGKRRYGDGRREDYGSHRGWHPQTYRDRTR
ncbi:hypothetical protein FRB95_008430 [Tulasnella sp. JGI-2019a]|nr:hypothetical protein FRB95_008430 [Tulasnella sp. JGI-2019a]